MNKLTITLAAMALSAGVYAQAPTAVKEAAKATVEKTEQMGNQAKAAMTTGSTKEAAKLKAEEHKAKAHHHMHKMKDAAKAKEDKMEDKMEDKK